MSVVILSHLACGPLRRYLISLGHVLRLLEDDGRYGFGVESHADLRFCKIGSGPVLERRAPPLSPGYPDNAAMCALALDGILIHRLDITGGDILKYCRGRSFREVNVRQGYTKCSCVAVDGGSVITSDPGIYRALLEVPGINVLKVREGFVSLPGFPTGFIGGASGRVGDEIIFNGDLSRHPDHGEIYRFIRSRGLGVRDFPGQELADIGSIIETEEESV